MRVDFQDVQGYLYWRDAVNKSYVRAISMRTKLTLFTVALLATLVMGGCCADCFMSDPNELLEIESTYDGSIYFPLHDTNRWILRHTGSVSDYYRTFTVVDTYQTDAGIAFLVFDSTRSVDNQYRTSTRLLYRFGHDTLYTAESQILPSGALAIGSWTKHRMMNPNRIGDAVTVSGSYFGHYNWVVARTGVTVQTQAGTFENCLVLNLEFKPVAWDEPATVETNYFAPEVGPVRIIEYPFSILPGDMGDTATVYSLERYYIWD